MKRTFKFCSGFPAHRFPFAWKKSVNLKSAETKLKCVNVSGIPNLAFKKKTIMVQFFIRSTQQNSIEELLEKYGHVQR